MDDLVAVVGGDLVADPVLVVSNPAVGLPEAVLDRQLDRKEQDHYAVGNLLVSKASEGMAVVVVVVLNRLDNDFH